MNKKFLFLLIVPIMIILLNNASAVDSWCYQESANVSNQTGIDMGYCELNYSGKYDYSVINLIGTIYVNYSLPDNYQQIGNLWMVKYVDVNGVLQLTNKTIPINCISNSNPVSFKIEVKSNHPQVFGLYCWNYSSSTWFNITNSTADNSGDNPQIPSLPYKAYDGNWNTYIGYTSTPAGWYEAYFSFAYFYEEAIYWNFSDNEIPSISYSSPTPANGTTQTSSRNVIVNVTLIDNNPWYVWINSTFGNTNITNTNQTFTNNSNISFSFSNLPNGNYTWNVTACDLANNCNTTDTYQINISNFEVGVYIYSPTESSIVSSSTAPYNLNMEYSITYPKTINCTYNVTGCNTIASTNFNCSATSLSIPLNTFTTCVIGLYANNTADGKNTTLIRTFNFVYSVPSTGGGGTPSPYMCDAKKWSVETDRGGTSQYLLMSADDKRNANLIFYNYGTTDLQLSLGCQSQSAEACKYVRISNSSIVVKPNKLQSTTVPIAIDLKGADADFDKIIFTISASDTGLCIGKIDFVIEQSALGNLFQLDKLFSELGSGFKIKIGTSEYTIYHWLIMLLILSVSLGIGGLLQNKRSLRNKSVLLRAFLVGVGVAILYIALIMLIK